MEFPQKMRALTQQNKYVQSRLMLAEKLEEENELFLKKMTELEVLLDQKQAVELLIERQKRAILVRKHMLDKEDMQTKKKIKLLKNQLRTIEEELEGPIRTTSEFQEAKLTER